ncbi:MAG: phosphodiester glycosidase family protein [Oscillospiraceae bacterium]|nr:phosphodiester glycosidase family protein [Oscillospiraceae bacterium]
MKKDSEKRKSIFDEMPDTSAEDGKREKAKRRERWRSINRFFDRLAGFIIVFVLVVGFTGLIFDYLCVKGPSPAFQSFWLKTFAETRRFNFVNNLFLSQKELDEIGVRMGSQSETIMMPTFNSSLVAITDEKTDVNGMDAYGLVDDDGDGIIFETINYKGSTGYMFVILDPTRVFMGCANGPEDHWGGGKVLDDIVAKYGALGGINAGIFVDTNGAGTGWPPTGITISEGVVYESSPYSFVCGLDSKGIMYVGDFNIDQCVNDFDIQNACSFGPVLIANGQKMDAETLDSGVNPRTCIGQRGDGAIIMLVVDGRQAYSFGVTYGDCADILLSYGCINAMNMDGGSSTSMYYNGKLINHPSNQAGGTRYLPTAWLFK